jgi:hypothetical protein
MGLTSGTNRLETGWKTRSKLPSAKAERSRMSHWMVSSSNSSRSATNLSCASCLGELSSTVTLAPAAAKVGACWPPPEARHRTSAPAISGNHDRGTGFVSVSKTSHCPRRAASITSGPTGTDHGLPSSTCLSQAPRLYSGTSI